MKFIKIINPIITCFVATSFTIPIASCQNTNVFLVSFDTNYGSYIEPQRVGKGKLVQQPTAPTRESYNFGGWFSDSSCTIAYDFSQPVTNDITLYAKWSFIPNDSLFNFSGTNCTINGNHIYEQRLKIGQTNVQFTIVPDEGYVLQEPQDLPEGVDYNDGILTIQKVENDKYSISILATTPKTWTFKFTGLSCKINGSTQYVENIIDHSKNVKFYITPNDGYALPTSVTCSVGDDKYSYKDGWITINDFHQDYEFSAISEQAEYTYAITFQGEGCKGQASSENQYLYSFTEEYSSKALSNPLINLQADTNYVLPEEDDIVVLIDGKEITSGFIYSKDTDSKTGSIVFTAKADGFIQIKAFNEDNSVVVEFDSLVGNKSNIKYESATLCNDWGKEIKKIRLLLNSSHTFKVTSNFGFNNLTEQQVSVTNVESFTFDVETGNLTFKIGQTTTNSIKISAYASKKTLDECTWDEIDQLAKENMAKDWFSVGDIKKNVGVSIDDGTCIFHEVIIIGFNHSYGNVNRNSITFQFNNVITHNQNVNNGNKIAVTKSRDSELSPGTYQTSELFQYLTSEDGLLSSLDADLLNVMKEVVNPSWYHNETGWVESNIKSKLFDISLDELNEESSCSEGVFYEYYEDNDPSKRIKYLVGEDKTPIQYWTRASEYGSDFDAQIHAIDVDGNLIMQDKNTKLGLAPCFVI